MAKNVLTDTTYRHLDVDAYDPDQTFADPAGEPESPGVNGPDEALVRQLLQGGKTVDALKAVLQSPPFNTKNQMVKDKTMAVVLKTLTSFKTSEIAGALGALSPEQLDILLMYIYKGMEVAEDGQSCAQLLAWHSQTFAVLGHSGIARVICSRKRL